MAHIPDGILSAPVLVGASLLATGGIAFGLRQLNEQSVPRAAILAAALFVGSLFSLPIGPASVHLLLSGVMGIILGAGAFPAVLVALFLQTVLFGFGGLTTLGVNTFNIALPGVLLGSALGPRLLAATPARRSLLAGLIGALSVLGTGAMVALTLALSSADYTPVASVMLATYLPLALVEAMVTLTIISFLARVRPDALRPAL